MNLNKSELAGLAINGRSTMVWMGIRKCLGMGSLQGTLLGKLPQEFHRWANEPLTKEDRD